MWSDYTLDSIINLVPLSQPYFLNLFNLTGMLLRLNEMDYEYQPELIQESKTGKKM